MLNQKYQILSLEIDKRDWLLVDIRDTEFGSHRISVSQIASICENHENNETLIETESSYYRHAKEKQHR